MKPVIVSLFGLVLVFGAPPVGGAGKGKDLDAAALVGNWKIVAGEKDGEKADEANLKKQMVSFDKENLTLRNEDLFVMKYTLDAKADPVRISFTITKSPFGAGAKAEGIIEIKGDDLKLCYALEGGKAPAKFETKAGSNHRLLIMKRAK